MKELAGICLRPDEAAHEEAETFHLDPEEVIEVPVLLSGPQLSALEQAATLVGQP